MGVKIGQKLELSRPGKQVKDLVQPSAHLLIFQLFHQSLKERKAIQNLGQMEEIPF